MSHTSTKTMTISAEGLYPVVQKLKDLLDHEEAMKTDLLRSLKAAVLKAKMQLNPELFKAINAEFNGHGWPTTIDDYYVYLNLYVRLIPNEERNPDYPGGWTSDGTKNGYNQKVYDLLCQFYWLVDQPHEGKTMQSYSKFSDWLVEFAQAWGEFLDTEESLTPETLASFANDSVIIDGKKESVYNFPLYQDNADTWTTFNQFFYREFNQAAPGTGITPVRPIAEPNNNQTITSPADCTFKMNYHIDEAGNVLDLEGNPANVMLKNTHSIGTIDELLDGSEFASEFYGGTFIHYFLNPFDYHRFHTPVFGEVKDFRAIQGKVFLNVDLSKEGQFDAPDGAGNGYEFNQARGLILLDAPNLGKVAVLPIGMAQVSGVDMYTDRIKPGDLVVKGQEFGKFKFGGSDIIVLLPKAPDLYLYKKDPGHNPIHFQYGQTIAYWNEANEQ